jgi:hypothetical protein
MTVLEAIAHAQHEDMVIRRPSWPEGRGLFFKNDVLHIVTKEGRESPIELFRTEAVLATDWIAE